MIIDNLTKRLFYPFFRRVGNPYQKLIHNIREFRNFLIENNGINDVFIAVYDERRNIDKIFFDLDILDFDLAKKFYNFLLDNDLSVVPVFSGKKGFHFYIMLKPTKFSEDEAISWLRKVSYTLIDESGMYKKETNKVTGEKYKVPFFDTRVIGDINRLTRVPNTLRPPENLTYCCVLPPDFVDMTLEDLFVYVKSPHYFNNGEHKIKRKYRLTQLPVNNDVIYDYYTVSSSQRPYSKYDSSVNIHIERLDKSIRIFLKLLLRKCLYYWITMDEPPHEIRTAVTIDLLHLGFSPDEIIAIFERLKWRDYSYKITSYHVNHIAKKCLKRYTCKKLMELGFCIPDCERREMYRYMVSY